MKKFQNISAHLAAVLMVMGICCVSQADAAVVKIKNFHNKTGHHFRMWSTDSVSLGDFTTHTANFKGGNCGQWSAIGHKGEKLPFCAHSAFVDKSTNFAIPWYNNGNTSWHLQRRVSRHPDKYSKRELQFYIGKCDDDSTVDCIHTLNESGMPVAPATTKHSKVGPTGGCMAQYAVELSNGSDDGIDVKFHHLDDNFKDCSTADEAAKKVGEIIINIGTALLK